MNGAPRNHTELLSAVDVSAQSGDWAEMRKLFDESPAHIFKSRACLYYLRSAIYDKNIESFARAIEILHDIETPQHLQSAIKKAIARAQFSAVPKRTQTLISDISSKFFLEKAKKCIAPRERYVARYSINDLCASHEMKTFQRHHVTIQGSSAVSDKTIAGFHEMRLGMEKWQSLSGSLELRCFENVAANRSGVVWRQETEGKFQGGTNQRLASLLPGVGVSISSALLVTDPTKGLYHWYLERLPALALSIKAGIDVQAVLFGDHNQKFQEEMINLCFDEPPNTIRVADEIQVEELFVPNVSIRFLDGRRLHSLLYDKLKENAAEAACGYNIGERVYISRRYAKNRKLINEQEVESRLDQLGFRSVALENISLAEQISLVTSAKIIVAPHGAGLSHIITSEQGARIFELVPTHQPWSLRFNFARISYLIGHQHFLWLEPANLLTEEWRVDIEPMMEALKQFIASE